MPDAVGITHHVKINGQYYLIRPGTYRKRGAPLFGSRFSTGDPDYNNLSFWQHWVQQCWVGGFGAATWQDDAMFDEGSGIDASQHEVMTLARDLGPSTNRNAAGNWDVEGQERQRQFTIFNGKLYLLSWGTTPGDPGRLYRFTEATGIWTLIHTFADTVRDMEPFAKYLVFGDGGPNLARMNTSEAFSTFAKPSGHAVTPDALRTYRGRLYVAFNTSIWRLKPDFTWDGSTEFYNAEGADWLHLADIHLGQLHFMSHNGHLIRTDGNNTFDIWQFEAGFVPTGLRSFDGRLFVSMSEPLEGTTATQAVLYQFTGSAVTELKRWGKVGRDIGTGRLRTMGSRMWFGAGCLLGMGDGFGIANYDPREDAYHIFATFQDGAVFAGGTEGIKWNVDDVIFFKGYMYCTVRGYGVFRAKLSYKDAQRSYGKYDRSVSGASIGSKNGGWYESSDFDAGTAGLLKLWNAITIHVDLPHDSTSVYVEISSDGGYTWLPAGGDAASATVTKTGTAWRYAKTIILQDTTAGTGVGYRSTRLKYRLTLRTTNTDYTPFLRAVVVRYLPVPEPNWQWDMQLVVSEYQELLDHSVEHDSLQTLDAAAVAAKVAALETPYRTQTLVNFIDIDGQQWTTGDGQGVLLTMISEDVPVPDANSAGVRERIVAVTLMEAVEAY